MLQKHWLVFLLFWTRLGNSHALFVFSFALLHYNFACQSRFCCCLIFFSKDYISRFRCASKLTANKLALNVKNNVYSELRVQQTSSVLCSRKWHCRPTYDNNKQDLALRIKKKRKKKEVTTTHNANLFMPSYTSGANALCVTGMFHLSDEAGFS